MTKTGSPVTAAEFLTAKYWLPVKDSTCIRPKLSYLMTIFSMQFLSQNTRLMQKLEALCCVLDCKYECVP